MEKASDNALVGNPQEVAAQIRERFHPDDRLMLWFDFFNHDSERVIRNMEAFVEEVGPEFPILMDPDGESIGAWQVFAAPSNFVVGADGKIHYTLFGGVEWDDDELVAQLKELANE